MRDVTGSTGFVESDNTLFRLERERQVKVHQGLNSFGVEDGAKDLLNVPFACGLKDDRRRSDAPEPPISDQLQTRKKQTRSHFFSAVWLDRVNLTFGCAKA